MPRIHFERVLVTTLPYLWLLIFFAAPFLIVLKISLAQAVLGLPPYTPLLQESPAGGTQLQLHFSNYALLASDRLYLDAYLHSLQVAGLSTLSCLIIGYPMAYAIARARPVLRTPLLMLVILPFWTSFLLRIYAWIGILKPNGLLNNLLLGLGLTDHPLPLLYSDFAVYVGIVYAYLPFMILPLYASLVRHDPALREAAADLGCRPWQTFWRITVPLSRPGILAGSLLVFIPAVGEFVIPDLLGGPDSLMIGKLLWTEFFANRDWPVAAAVAVALVALLVIPAVVLDRLRERQLEAPP